MRTIKVNITEQDFKKGIAMDPRLCPVARAIGRVVEGGVRVYHIGIVFGSELNRVDGQDLVVGQNDSVTELIVEFGHGHKVSPKCVDINVPDYVKLKTKGPSRVRKGK